MHYELMLKQKRTKAGSISSHTRSRSVQSSCYGTEDELVVLEAVACGSGIGSQWIIDPEALHAQPGGQGSQSIDLSMLTGELTPEDRHAERRRFVLRRAAAAGVSAS